MVEGVQQQPVLVWTFFKATNTLLMKSDPSSGFPPKYLQITVNQSVTAKSRAN